MMDSLQMLTSQDVSELLHMTLNNITMLRENHIINAIKTGRNYMYSQEEIKRFQRDYAGLDVSNYYRAIESREIVNKKRGSNPS